MINEELQDRATGKPLPEAESSAAKSFFSRNIYLDDLSRDEELAIVSEVNKLAKPENKQQKNLLSKDLGEGLFALQNERYGFWVFYDTVNPKNPAVFTVPAIGKTQEQAAEIARKEYLNTVRKRYLKTVTRQSVLSQHG